LIYHSSGFAAMARSASNPKDHYLISIKQGLHLYPVRILIDH